MNCLPMQTAQQCKITRPALDRPLKRPASAPLWRAVAATLAVGAVALAGAFALVRGAPSERPQLRYVELPRVVIHAKRLAPARADAVEVAHEEP